MEKGRGKKSHKVRTLLISYWCKGISGRLQGIELSSPLPQREEMNCDSTLYIGKHCTYIK